MPRMLTTCLPQELLLPECGSDAKGVAALADALALAATASLTANATSMGASGGLLKQALGVSVPRPGGVFASGARFALGVVCD